MSGGGGFLTTESETCLGEGLGASGGGFRATGGLWRGTYGSGPSSTTQSLRSMSDVFLPKIGGEGEGEGGTALIWVEGRMGVNVVAIGEMGVSRRSGGGREGTTVALEACMASNACTLALTADEAMLDDRPEGVQQRTEGARRGRRCSERRRRGKRRPWASCLPGGYHTCRGHFGRGTGGSEWVSALTRWSISQTPSAAANPSLSPSIITPRRAQRGSDSMAATPTTDAQLRAATVGFDHLFANDLEKARGTFANGDSPFHLLGHGVCAFLEAALGMEVSSLLDSDSSHPSSVISVGRPDGRGLTSPGPLRGRLEEGAEARQVGFSVNAVSPRNRVGAIALRRRHPPWPHPRSQVGPCGLFDPTCTLTHPCPLASRTWAISSAYML